VVKVYETERDVKMAPGDTVTVGGYALRFDGTVERDGPNFRAARGNILVSRDGKTLRVLHPEKRVYGATGMPMTEAAIDTGFLGDLYVSLGEPIEGDTWAVRVYHKPLVTWIWGGCMLMALGGLLALSDRRYRMPARRDSTIAANAAAAR